MPSPTAVRTRNLLEVACDESGSEGEKLVRGSTHVFAHASVDVTTDRALDTIDRVRVEARSPATEVKASVVLRPQNWRLLEWLLGEDGPFLGHAHVHLTDKALHLTRRMVALLDGPAPTADASRRAVSLHEAARRRLGVVGWESVLADFNDVVRARSADEAMASARSLRARLAELDDLGSLVDGLVEGVPLDGVGLDLLVGHGRTVLDPIVPALADVLRRWGSQGRPLWVVHDVQATLTDAAIRTAVGASPGGSSDALEGITFVDSQHDARVQLADFLAGASRRIAAHVLEGRADPQLVDLLAPYISPRSTWLGPWPSGGTT